jgi:hypothetical protein
LARFGTVDGEEVALDDVGRNRADVALFVGISSFFIENFEENEEKLKNFPKFPNFNLKMRPRSSQNPQPFLASS